ncbi:hypothetical protein PQR66_39910 [Paraburkholderia agricolaris]|uniref:Uncharacterized protein n=1 Tax=Paraburkholderia agricolaris TaxID=2152888 RepID=A0ABW9A141_9BURK
MLKIAIAVAALTGAYLLLIDGFFFRSSLPKDYRAFVFTDGAGLRSLNSILRSAAEVIVFQLTIGSTLVWLLGRAWHDANERVAAATCFAGLILARLLNCGLNVPIQNGTICYEALRFFCTWSDVGFPVSPFGLGRRACRSFIDPHILLACDPIPDVSGAETLQVLLAARLARCAATSKLRAAGGLMANPHGRVP